MIRFIVTYNRRWHKYVEIHITENMHVYNLILVSRVVHGLLTLIDYGRETLLGIVGYICNYICTLYNIRNNTHVNKFKSSV